MTEAKDQFDLKQGEALKELGIMFASQNRLHELAIARKIAREIALKSPDHTCHMDLVQFRLIDMGIDLGNSAGGLFKDSSQWVWTGRFVKSARKTNHARIIRIWKLLSV